MSELYYDLEKTAEILKLTPAEVNRLREQGEIQGFRDGSNWKFKREVIDNYYLTLTQKKTVSPFSTFGSTGEEENLLSSEDEQELPTMMADSASFAQFGDSLVSLQGGKTDSVSAASDANLADGLALVSDEHLDELALSDDILKPQVPKEQKIEIFGIQGENGIPGMGLDSGSGLNLGGDSGLSIISGSGSGIDLAGSDRIFDDDDVVIGGSSSGLNLGGDSGISLLDAATESGFSLGASAGGSDAILELAPDDDILALIDAEVDPDTATVFSAETDDFQLQADDDLFLTDDSESSSQVIAIEGDLAGDLDSFAFSDAPVAASDDLLFSTADEGSVAFTEVGGSADSPFGGLDSSGDFGDMSGFGTGGGIAAGFGASASDPMAAVAVPVASTSMDLTPKFTGLSVAGLVVMVAVMTVGASLMFELVRCMWSWSEPFTINSSILSLFGK